MELTVEAVQEHARPQNLAVRRVHTQTIAAKEGVQSRVFVGAAAIRDVFLEEIGRVARRIDGEPEATAQKVGFGECRRRCRLEDVDPVVIRRAAGDGEVGAELHAHDRVRGELEGARDADRRIDVDRFATGEHIGKAPVVEADGLRERHEVDIERVEVLALETRAGMGRRRASVGRDVNGSDGVPPDFP